MKLVATVKDTDYAYIDTFISFLDKIITVIGHLFDVIGTGFAKLTAATEKTEGDA